MQLVLVLLVSIFIATSDIDTQQTNNRETFGRTDSEILAMGQAGWFDYYTSRAGESTMAMSDAYRYYLEAAQRRNAAMSDRNHAAELGPLLRDFGEKALDIASNYSGGGTLWIPMYGEMSCDVEDLRFALLGGEAAPVMPMTTGMVNRAIQQLDSLIEAANADPDATAYFRYYEAQAALSALQQDWKQIKKLAASLNRSHSDHVLAFCHSWATVIELVIESEGC